MAFASQPPVHRDGKFREKRLLTSAKEEMGSPTLTRWMPSEARQTAVITTMATKVEGSSFFKIGLPVLPSTIGSPRQIAVVQIMTTKLKSKPPVYASLLNPKTLLASPHQMSTAMPFMNPEITMLGTNLTREPTRQTAHRMRQSDITINVILMNLFLQS